MMAAVFSGADFQSADLTGADLGDNDFSDGSGTFGANFSGAGLSSICWHRANSSDALHDKGASFPDSFDPLPEKTVGQGS